MLSSGLGTAIVVADVDVVGVDPGTTVVTLGVDHGVLVVASGSGAQVNVALDNQGAEIRRWCWKNQSDQGSAENWCPDGTDGFFVQIAAK